MSLGIRRAHPDAPAKDGAGPEGKRLIHERFDPLDLVMEELRRIASLHEHTSGRAIRSREGEATLPCKHPIVG